MILASPPDSLQADRHRDEFAVVNLRAFRIILDLHARYRVRAGGVVDLDADGSGGQAETGAETGPWIDSALAAGRRAADGNVAYRPVGCVLQKEPFAPRRVRVPGSYVDVVDRWTMLRAREAPVTHGDRGDGRGIRGDEGEP